MSPQEQNDSFLTNKQDLRICKLHMNSLFFGYLGDSWESPKVRLHQSQSTSV